MFINHIPAFQRDHEDLWMHIEREASGLGKQKVSRSSRYSHDNHAGSG